MLFLEPAGILESFGKIFIHGGARDTSSEVWLITKPDWLKMNVVIIILSSMNFEIKSILYATWSFSNG